MSKNIYKLFYKDYYSRIDFSYLFEQNSVRRKEIEDSNQAQIAFRNRELLEVPLTLIPRCKRANVQVPIQVQYPGLVTGTGINHEANIEGEFKLGIHLDYTYGMPIIYGSTVKGILRSAFEDKSYIKSLLGKEIDIDDLIKDIFDGQERDPKNEDPIKKTKAYMNKSIYNRDIFFDAVVISPDSTGRILASDYITPHKNPLRDPVPIGFIKIASGCTLELRFRLVSSLITNAEKLELFLKILLDSGVGAKTNVGYGQLSTRITKRKQ